MTQIRPQARSVVERSRVLAAGAAIVGAHFIADTAVFVLGEEALLFVDKEARERRVAVHAGAILASAGGDARIITGGDDGAVMATENDGKPVAIATDAKRRWIDRVAVGPDGAVAWSAGKQAFVLTRNGQTRALDLPSAAGGLAFLPKGFRLAIAHYNGATLWFANAQSAPQMLDWKGSHLDAAVSPDGRFLVTAMQEPTLHGWRLEDGKHMRMAGYAARVRAMSWTADGKGLATAGSTQIILWPFHGKDGPMGKAPKMLAEHEHLVGIVACHPRQPVVAAGYRDGLILLAHTDDGTEIIVRNPGEAPVSALAWNAAGTVLAFGTEDGVAGLADLA